jgi:hypothetical protein
MGSYNFHLGFKHISSNKFPRINRYDTKKMKINYYMAFVIVCTNFPLDKYRQRLSIFERTYIISFQVLPHVNPTLLRLHWISHGNCILTQVKMKWSTLYNIVWSRLCTIVLLCILMLFDVLQVKLSLKSIVIPIP